MTAKTYNLDNFVGTINDMDVITVVMRDSTKYDVKVAGQKIRTFSNIVDASIYVDAICQLYKSSDSNIITTRNVNELFYKLVESEENKNGK